MKKIIGIAFVVCLAAIMLGCASSAKSASSQPETGGIPPNIQRARFSPPDGVIAGMGNAKMANINQSRVTAAQRARVEISQTLDSLTNAMVMDFFAGNEADLSAVMAYTQNISYTLSRSSLSGAEIILEEQGSDGQWWVVMYLSKSNVVQEINQAQAAAKLAIPAMAAYNAEEMMQAAFDREFARAAEGR